MNTLSITIREPAANQTPLDRLTSGAEPTVRDLLGMLGLPPKAQDAFCARYPGRSTPNSYQELCKIPGFGTKYAKRVYAALCFKSVLSVVSNMYLKPRDVWEQLSDIRENMKEHFIVFYLDTRNKEIKRDIISIGCLNANLVHPREVFEPAVKCLAAAVIVAHNHPSGNLEPSDEDINLTKRLASAGKLLGIELLDHVIVSKDGFASFKEKGLL